MAMELDLSDSASVLKITGTESGKAPLLPRCVLYIAKKSNDIARRTDGTIHRRLADLLIMRIADNSVPRHGVFTRDVVIDPASKVFVRIFLPEVKGVHGHSVAAADGSNDMEVKKLPVIFYFHGGGFAVLSADSLIYDIFCRRLCRRTGAIVISVDYRRSPEYRFPTAYDDCEAAVRWLIKEGASSAAMNPYTADVKRIALMGDSAGANITHELGCRFSRPRNADDCRITANVLLFPYFGGEERTPSELRLRDGPLLNIENMDWHWRAFLPKESRLGRDHPACNVLGPNGPPDVLSGQIKLPASLVIVAEFDPLKDWQLRYAQGLLKLPVPPRVKALYYTRGAHCFHLIHMERLSSRLLDDVVAFLNEEGFL